MLGLLVVSVPIVLVNELNAIAALILVRGGDFLAVFDQAQRNALAMLFLNLHNQGFVIAEIFWGLWLFPLGLLVWRSGFMRVLGILLEPTREMQRQTCRSQLPCEADSASSIDELRGFFMMTVCAGI